MSQKQAFLSGTGAAPIETLTGNSGGPVGPDGAGNIDLVGTGTITVTGNPGTNTLEISVSGAVADEFQTDSGTAIPVGGVLTVSGGSNIGTTGAGSTLTINLDNTVSISGSMTAGTGLTATMGGVTASGNSSISGGTIVINATGTNLIDATGLLELNSSGAAINIGNDAVNQNIGIGTAGTRTITLGSATGTTSIPAVSITGGSITGITDLTVADGGTGVSTMTTAYAPVCAGTTATGALQVASTNMSNSGYVLTSNGSSALPSWEAASMANAVTAASTIADNTIVRGDGGSRGVQTSVPTIDDTGNVLVSTAVSGGSLSVQVANSSNTASATAFYNAQVAGSTASDAYYKAEISGAQAWTLGLDNSDSDAFVISASGTPGTTNIMRVSTAGEINYPLQPAFAATFSGDATNVTGDGTNYLLVLNTEQVDQNSDYNSGTGVFTAPVTGVYTFTGNIILSNLSSSHTALLGWIALTGVNIYSIAVNPYGSRELASNLYGFSLVATYKMTANDTASLNIVVTGGTKTVSVLQNSWFAGHLVC